MRKQETSQLQEVRTKFEEWRRVRTKRILSDELWQEATRLVGEYSISRICRELRIHPEYLKRKTI